MQIVSSDQRAVTVDIYLASRALNLSIALWDITSVNCESASGLIAHIRRPTEGGSMNACTRNLALRLR